jgi:hypothetical protein
MDWARFGITFFNLRRNLQCIKWSKMENMKHTTAWFSQNWIPTGIRMVSQLFSNRITTVHHIYYTILRENSSIMHTAHGIRTNEYHVHFECVSFVCLSVCLSLPMSVCLSVCPPLPTSTHKLGQLVTLYQCKHVRVTGCMSRLYHWNWSTSHTVTQRVSPWCHRRRQRSLFNSFASFCWYSNLKFRWKANQLSFIETGHKFWYCLVKYLVRKVVALISAALLVVLVFIFYSK